MTSANIMLLLGDEFVHPVSTVWAKQPGSDIASRSEPQAYDCLQAAMDRAGIILRASPTSRDFPWVRAVDGRVFSPAYLRAYGENSATVRSMQMNRHRRNV